MDARIGRPFLPLPGPIDVRLSDLGELAASLPHLLGFRPLESVVLVGLTGPGGGRVGLTVRADIPPPEHVRAVAEVASRGVLTDRPGGVLVAVVSEASDTADGLPHRELVRRVVVELADHGVPVPEVILVRDGRWWSYDCPHPCCAPGSGTPLPSGVTELEVAAVATGVVVEPDRDGLAARIAPPTAGLGKRSRRPARTWRWSVRTASSRTDGRRWPSGLGRRSSTPWSARVPGRRPPGRG
jgi:hypothetical protein